MVCTAVCRLPTSFALPTSRRAPVATARPRQNFTRAVAAAEAPSKPKPAAEKPSPTPAPNSPEAPIAKKPVPGEVKPILQIVDGKFSDYRWSNGTWDFSHFRNAEGKMDWESWDKVIDAEMGRRKILEDNPIPSINEDPVNFDTADIPWFAWVKRFHLPEAEKINGRAAMVGYALAFVVDSLSGAGLVDQQNSFLGKLLLHITIFALLIFRSGSVIPLYKGLIDEATFYDKQWQATWDGVERPSETEK